jgi:hypothetical protein
MTLGKEIRMHALFRKEKIMKNVARCCIILALSLMCFCTFLMDGPTQPATNDHYSGNKPSDPVPHQQFSKKIGGFFPFEDNSNRWNYTESGGNTVVILVTDTISDDGITYFRVSFRENRVDTTDDWFMRSVTGVYFGQSLTGKYGLFLPARLDSVSGTFESSGSTVVFDYYDSLSVNGVRYKNVVHLKYNNPIIHGFDEITLADSIGIVELVDHTGRWPINYAIDSCRVGGNSRSFR